MLFPARHPAPDVRRTVAKHNALTFTPAQETDGFTIDENQVLEVQHDGPACRFHREQLEQLAYVVGFKSALADHWREFANGEMLDNRK